MTLLSWIGGWTIITELLLALNAQQLSFVNKCIKWSDR